MSRSDRFRSTRDHARSVQRDVPAPVRSRADVPSSSRHAAPGRPAQRESGGGGDCTSTNTRRARGCRGRQSQKRRNERRAQHKHCDQSAATGARPGQANLEQPWQQQVYNAQQDAYHARQQCSQLAMLIQQQNDILHRLAKSVEAFCSSAARNSFINARQSNKKHEQRQGRKQPAVPHRHTEQEFQECETLLRNKLQEIITARENMLKIPEVAVYPTGCGKEDSAQERFDKLTASLDKNVKDAMQQMRDFDAVPDRPADAPFLAATWLVQQYNKCDLDHGNYDQQQGRYISYSSLKQEIIDEHLHKTHVFDEHGNRHVTAEKLYVDPGQFQFNTIHWKHPANKARNGSTPVFKLPSFDKEKLMDTQVQLDGTSLKEMKPGDVE